MESTKRILGLDIGTNSIGWAVIEIDHDQKTLKLVGLGSRIIPMDAGEIKDFESKGKIKSTAAIRSEKRGPRKLNERYLLRRDRLHLVLNILNALPDDYRIHIDFKRNGKRCGQFKSNAEPKLAYLPKTKGKKAEFRFYKRYQEMLTDMGFSADSKPIPFDWTLYYLRSQALLDPNFKMNLEELAWVLLSYNQKRGYQKTEVLDQSTKAGELQEELDVRVKAIEKGRDENGTYYEITLNDSRKTKYKEYSNEQLSEKRDLKEIIITSKLNEDGSIKESTYKIVDIYPLKIEEVKYELTTDTNPHKYTVFFSNGWTDEESRKNYTNEFQGLVGKAYDYIVTSEYDKLGNFSKRTLRKPDFAKDSSDWTLLKKKTEKEALQYNSKLELIQVTGAVKKYISTNIYKELKADAKNGTKRKMIGGMFQVVDREFYRQELNQIIESQKKHHAELQDAKIFEQCIQTLYPNNDSHRNNLAKNKKALQHLLVEDILLYQRPLKSKKSEIGNCKYEIRYWEKVTDKNGNAVEKTDAETGEVTPIRKPIYYKAVSVSHPYYQEYRIWDKLHNLKIIEAEVKNEKTGKTDTNVDVTAQYLKNENDYQKLFEILNHRRSFNQEQFLKFCKDNFDLPYNSRKKNFTWNFPEEEELKGNETRASFITRLKRSGMKDEQIQEFLTQEKEKALWHYLYSVNYLERTAKENKSVKTFFSKFFEGNDSIEASIKQRIIKDFTNYPKFASRYGAFSEKALKKLIPLMRMNPSITGTWEQESWYKNWLASLQERKQEILDRVKKYDYKIYDNEADEIQKEKRNKALIDNKSKLPFPKGLFSSLKYFEKYFDFQKLNLTQASYLVYGRHSELAQFKKWNSPDEIREQLHQELKQHSLNNPVAEKVILEMMQVVADIWEYYGEGSQNYFTKIHIEVGRELKQSVKDKERVNDRNKENRKQNKRIRSVLSELLENTTYKANPRNSDHFERLKIMEDGAFHTKNIDKGFFNRDKVKNGGLTDKDVKEFLKSESISRADFEKYKLWLEQGYISPYSGRPIKLSELFDGNKYNVDHIFPQARVTNNSLSNKVVVEVGLNKLKSDQTALEFIQEKGGQMYHGDPILKEDDYIKRVKTQFSGTKRMILLSREIPKGFTNSQLNNARHIARKAMELLSNIVREPGEIEFRSKHVLPVTGRITSDLKRQWQFTHVWNDLVTPRFKRLNELTDSNLFGKEKTSEVSGHKYFDCNLDEALREQNEDYDIKRIDHRHHALDALVVAMCTEEHVNYLNNVNANVQKKDIGKQKQLEAYRLSMKRKIMFTEKEDDSDERNWKYIRPGDFRKPGLNESKIDSVEKVNYHGTDDKDYGRDYKRMVLKTLQDTLASFKQKKSNIRKTSNYYYSYYDENGKKKDKKSLTKQIDENDENFKSNNKRNIAIRNKMHDEIPYGSSKTKFEWLTIAKEVGKRENIINENIRLQVEDAFALNDSSVGKTKAYLRKHPLLDENGIPILETAFKITDTTKQNISTIRKELTFIDNFKKLKRVANYQLQEELIKHLQKYDTIQLEFDDGCREILYSVEIDELRSICEVDEQFDSLTDLIDFLKSHDYKYKKRSYEKLNLFVEKVNEKFDIKRYTITKNYKLAFSPSGVEDFNRDRPVPVNKVKIFEFSKLKYHLGIKIGNKHKMVEGTNSLFVIDRIGEIDYETIKLVDEIDAYNKGKKLDLIDSSTCFTLKAGDLVYIPTIAEYENPSIIEKDNIDPTRVYKFVNSSDKDCNFVPANIANVIYKLHDNTKRKKFAKDKNLNFKTLIKNELGLGSPQQKHQNSLDGIQVKSQCFKLKVNRLGKIEKVIN